MIYLKKNLKKVLHSWLTNGPIHLKTTFCTLLEGYLAKVNNFKKPLKKENHLLVSEIRFCYSIAFDEIIKSFSNFTHF